MARHKKQSEKVGFLRKLLNEGVEAAKKDLYEQPVGMWFVQVNEGIYTAQVFCGEELPKMNEDEYYDWYAKNVKPGDVVFVEQRPDVRDEPIAELTPYQYEAVECITEIVKAVEVPVMKLQEHSVTLTYTETKQVEEEVTIPVITKRTHKISEYGETWNVDKRTYSQLM